MNTVDARSALTNEPGHLLSWSLIAILGLLLWATLEAGIEEGPVKPGLGSVLGGIYIIAWGLCFLASYYYGHKAFFLRGLMWICENFSHPASRKMAFFYFGLATLVGGATILAGLGLL
jgi:hypothetical protein